MRTRNAMQLKALINNRAKAAGISPQLMLQDYLYERLLDRLSRSRWRNNVIVKGDIHQNPRLVALTEVVVSHRLLEALQHLLWVTPARMYVLGEAHGHRRVLERVHDQVVSLSAAFWAHSADVAILAVANPSFERVVSSLSHVHPPLPAWGCHRNGRPSNCG